MVPSALRPKLNRREVIVALGTKDETEARAKAVEEAKRIEQLFHQTRIALLEEEGPHPHDVGTPEQNAIALRALEYRPDEDRPPELWSLSYLLEAWGDDMTPLNLEKYREAEMAVARFIYAMGTLPVGQITPAVLRNFQKKLKTVPHHPPGSTERGQRYRRGLDKRAIASTMRELRRLLKWWKDGVAGRLA